MGLVDLYHRSAEFMMDRSRTEPRWRPIRAFTKDRKGATAVEFALVCVPFFALIFAIIETALVFFAGQMLESAVADASRRLLTGQTEFQDEERFKALVCARMVGLFDCDGGLAVDVRVLASFGPPPPRPVDGAGNLDTSDFGFNPGGGGDILLVRAVYPWPVVVSLLGFNLADMPDGNRLLIATSAFRNEPFGEPGGT
jgi:Flp pilus assembly protein TadG